MIDAILDTLPQTEADVVFVAVNEACGVVEVWPQWECDMDKAALYAMAAKMGLIVAERCGGGEVTVQWRDNRVN